MRTILMALLLVLIQASCATTGRVGPYGNFVPAAANPQSMAADAVQKLATLYPPAQTRFALHHATPDAFGIALVHALRQRGYALLEFNPNNKAQAPAAPAPVKASAILPLRYVLDQAGTANLYRLTVMAGNQSLTRPYREENGAFVPAGYWAHKE